MEMINVIDNILNNKKTIKLKIYSLVYIIELIEDYYVIYPELYDNRKKRYNSLNDMFNSYTIYNESLIDSINRIIIIDDKEVI